MSHPITIMDAAQTRLRKAFKYPTDDGNTAGRDYLDEQQQEQLIISLQKFSTTDLIYTRIFYVLPLVAITPFFLHFQGWKPFPALMCIVSLLWTAEAMGLVPVSVTARHSGREKWWMPFQWPEKGEQWYGHRILQWVNMGLCLLLGLGSYLTFRVHDGKEESSHFGLLLLVPGVMFGVVSVVRQSMADVQEGVGKLEEMTYGLKGA